MTNDPVDKNTEKDPVKDENKDAAIQPDPETLHTKDPQKKMEGPLSSLMHKAGKGFDSDTTKEEADDEKEKNM